MAYELRQFNYSQSEVDPAPSSQQDNIIFMTAYPKENFMAGANIINESITTDLKFQEEYIAFTENGGNFEAGRSYYIHALIKARKAVQEFNVKLKKDTIEQFIKTVTIGQGIGWVDVEFIFTPADTYKFLYFELKRTNEDYQKGERIPQIIFQEISLINNTLPAILGAQNESANLIKLGIQTRPGFLMCLNKEEIRVGRTGIYEIKNGIILLNSFSVISGTYFLKTVQPNPIETAKEYIYDNLHPSASSTDKRDIIVRQSLSFEEEDPYWNPVQGSVTGKTPEEVRSSELGNTNFIFENDASRAKRLISGFTMDYLYKTEGS